jgi:hypothetical protein
MEMPVVVTLMQLFALGKQAKPGEWRCVRWKAV